MVLKNKNYQTNPFWFFSICLQTKSFMHQSLKIAAQNEPILSHFQLARREFRPTIGKVKERMQNEESDSTFRHSACRLGVSACGVIDILLMVPCSQRITLALGTTVIAEH